MYTEVRNNEGELNVIGWKRIPLRYSIQFIVYITKFGTSMVNTIHAKTHRQMLLCAPGITDPYSTGIKKISDPKTNLKHDCFIEFVYITVYEIFFLFS